MIYIGCHLSVIDGYEAMGKTMTVFGGNTFAWFTRNPRGGKSKPVIKEDVEALLEYVSSKGFGPYKDKAGVCLDTCHIWDAGYDIVDDLDGVLQRAEPAFYTGNPK